MNFNEYLILLIGVGVLTGVVCGLQSFENTSKGWRWLLLAPIATPVMFLAYGLVLPILLFIAAPAVFFIRSVRDREILLAGYAALICAIIYGIALLLLKIAYKKYLS
jgi:hypothetical protein